MRASTKIALGFLILCTTVLVGYRYGTRIFLSQEGLVSLAPGRVNMVGLLPHSGYRVVISNQTVQLVQDDHQKVGTTLSSGLQKKLPFKEILEVLGGNERSVGKLVGFLNDVPEPDSIDSNLIWDVSAIRRAFLGDRLLAGKLYQEFNLIREGIAKPSIKQSMISREIFLRFPVTLGLPYSCKRVKGYFLESFRPRWLVEFENRLQSEFVLSDKRLQELYEQFLDQPGSLGSLEQELTDRVSEKRLYQLVQPVERILKNFVIIFNENQVLEANEVNYKTQVGQDLSKLLLKLNKEAHKRLWKFSQDFPRAQLIFAVDGIPIATSLLSGEFLQREITVMTLPNLSLIQEALEIFKHPESLGEDL